MSGKIGFSDVSLISNRVYVISRNWLDGLYHGTSEQGNITRTNDLPANFGVFSFCI
jgi:hypothetical protein